MNKIELRKIFQGKRNQLNEPEIEDWSTKIASKFLQEIDLSSVRIIHFFLPIVNKKEVDLRYLIDQIHVKFPEIKFQIPVIENGVMISVDYHYSLELTEGQYGIKEPKSYEPSHLIPDLVLTPLLAYDQKGYRVGYGGGFYDKFFESLPANVVKIGLSFFECIETIEDLNEFDIPLDFCITPSKVYDFKFMGY